MKVRGSIVTSLGALRSSDDSDTFYAYQGPIDAMSDLANNRYEVVLYKPSVSKISDLSPQYRAEIKNVINTFSQTPVVIVEPKKKNLEVNRMLDECLEIGAFSTIVSPETSRIQFNKKMNVLSIVANSKRDQLTGLLNKEQMRNIVSSEFNTVQRRIDLYNESFARAKSQDERNGLMKPDVSLTYAVIDLDDFKGINDNYGHAAGDKVLRFVADQMTRGVEHFRSSDSVSRFGGDEFTLLLPGVHDYSGIARKIGRVLDQISNADLADIVGSQAKGKRIGMSVGIATYPEPARVNTPEDFFELADIAAYNSKKIRSAEKVKGSGYVISGYAPGNLHAVELARYVSK